MTAQPDGHRPEPAGGATAPPAPSVIDARAPTRLTLVPRDSPRRALVTPLGVSPLGEPVLLGLAPHDARHHVHVPGPTGTGKTTLLVNYVISQARTGRGVAAFDGKGDFVRDLLHRLPPDVAGRLVLIDPDETEAPSALNLFDLAADPETVADQLVGVMAKVWAQYWGPRTDDLARHAVLTLAHLPGASLADLPVLLADPVFRRQVIEVVRRHADPVQAHDLAAFWAWYDDLSPGQASVQTGPLLSKLRAVTSRRFAAGLFGVGVSTFRLADILDGGVLLVRLPPSLGDDTVRLVGSLLLAALLHAASARATQPEEDRLDATLVIDEAQKFLHLPVGIDDALAQARAFRLSLVLAHQYLGQLGPGLAAAVNANARNKVMFALAFDDARQMAHHVEPYFAPEDLTHREAYGVVCRLVIDGRDSEPFSLHTRPAPPPWPGRAETLRAAARTRGLPASEREAMLRARRAGSALRTTDTTDPATDPATGPRADSPPHTGHRPKPPPPRRDRKEPS